MTPTGHRGLLISASAASGPGALVGSHDGDVVALVPDDESSDAASLAKAVAARIGKRTCVTVAGVGPISDLARIPSAHEEGARTVSALIALGHRGIGAAATQLGFAGLIVGSDPDVGDYVQRLLGPLLDYDARRGTDLVGTLAAYFAAGGSPAPRRRHRCTFTSTPCRSGSSASRPCSVSPGSSPTSPSSSSSRCASGRFRVPADARWRDARSLPRTPAPSQ